jgi:hypothetical protein
MAASNAFGETFASEMLSEFGFDRCEKLGRLSAGGDLVGDACGPGQQRCGFVVAEGVEPAGPFRAPLVVSAKTLRA